MMEAAAAAKASSRLARSLAAAAPCYSGVFVFFAALVAGALVSACWMSVSARVRLPAIHSCFFFFHGALSLL
jgi:hypothetical protein